MPAHEIATRFTDTVTNTAMLDDDKHLVRRGLMSQERHPFVFPAEPRTDPNWLHLDGGVGTFGGFFSSVCDDCGHTDACSCYYVPTPTMQAEYTDVLNALLSMRIDWSDQADTRPYRDRSTAVQLLDWRVPIMDRIRARRSSRAHCPFRNRMTERWDEL